MIELGSIEALGDRCIDLLSQVTESIAIAIDAAQSRLQLQDLLNQSQAQSEELQAQTETLQVREEDLTNSNQDLAEKTAKLQASEEALQQQSEELQATNEELEEKTEFLQKQKTQIEQAKRGVEEKAEDAALASKYKSEFLANMSHELRTPLNSLLLLSKSPAGNTKGNLTPDQVEAAEVIHSGGQKVEQILRNLLSNAMKFTETGSVTLRVSRPEVGSRFRHRNLTRDTAIAFSVIDTGTGIAPDKQQAIFESFQQADGSTCRQYGGTGLGLTISREFAKLLGGEIHLQSQLGEGSAFTLCLPLKPTGETKPESEPEPEHRDATVGGIPAAASESEWMFLPDDRAELGPDDRTILIVEDDRRFARVLMDLCHQKEFKCLAAGTGGDALQMAAEYRPSGILLDLGLPDMDGMVVLDELKRNLGTRHIPVHVVSARDRSTAALTKGAIGFLSKPVTSDGVMRALDDVEKLLNSTAKRLLVVEDDASIRQFIAKTVQFKGVDITEAASGEEGYQQLVDRKFDCLILDLGLHDLNGYELLRKLEKESIPIPPVIVYSGQNLTSSERAGLEAFGCSVVVKNTAAPELLADKVSLFLHSVESSLPEDQRRKIRMLHDPAQQLRGKKVLLVDDDMRNTFALSRVIEEAGLNVVLAENGQLALDVLEREDDIDLVLMDIMMPVMDGYEAMRRIRQEERTAQLPILALTAKAMPEDRAMCLEAGANDYLTKPVDIDRLMSLIRVWTLNRTVVCK